MYFFANLVRHRSANCQPVYFGPMLEHIDDMITDLRCVKSLQ